MKKPARVSPGDLLGIAALSGPVNLAALETGRAMLKDAGYPTRLAGNMASRSGVLGLAGSDSERLEAYRALLCDPDVKAILFARGGYGIGRLLAQLDPDEVGRHPKIHCGFSDVTALSAFLLRRCSLPSFHGPMVAADLSRERDPLSASFFPSMLEGRGPGEIDLTDADVLVPGSGSGPLVGGCLSLLAALVGSPDEFDYDGALLFIEDVAEEAYRIDRMLGTLARAGRFDRLKGILVGAMSGITFGGVEDPERLRDLLLERFLPLGIPVVMGLPFGHRGPNIVVPVGGQATWDGQRKRLRFEEEIVS
ncbi:MAG: LD-carboxypeptidase [Thermoanaerobaculia bacterium]